MKQRTATSKRANAVVTSTRTYTHRKPQQVKSHEEHFGKPRQLNSDKDDELDKDFGLDGGADAGKKGKKGKRKKKNMYMKKAKKATKNVVLNLAEYEDDDDNDNDDDDDDDDGDDDDEEEGEEEEEEEIWPGERTGVSTARLRCHAARRGARSFL